MLTYRPDTPEARLATLLDLAERTTRLFASKPNPAVLDALEAADHVLADQIRAVSAEIGKLQAAQTPREFKVGDRVRVVRGREDNGISFMFEGAEGVIVKFDDTGTSETERAHCWHVAGDGDWGWHTSEELALIAP